MTTAASVCTQPRPGAVIRRRFNSKRMPCIQCLKLLRCQCQRQCDGVFLYMCHGPGFGNCDDVTTANGPGQCNSGCGATVCCGNTPKVGITQQAGAESAKRRIGHHRHAVPFAPRQQVAFNAAAAEVVRDLIRRAAIAFRGTSGQMQKRLECRAPSTRPRTDQRWRSIDTCSAHAPGASIRND